MPACIVCGQQSPVASVDLCDVTLKDAPKPISDHLRESYEVNGDVTVYEFSCKVAKALGYLVGNHDLYLIDNEGTVLGHQKIQSIESHGVETHASLEEAVQAAIDEKHVYADDYVTAEAHENIEEAVEYLERELLTEEEIKGPCSESKVGVCITYQPPPKVHHRD
ncbi:hypothetical protein DICA0_F16270 [Diutina catenulata]